MPVFNKCNEKKHDDNYDCIVNMIVNSKPLFFEKRYFQLNLYRKLKSFITVINQATKKQNVLKDSENN